MAERLVEEIGGLLEIVADGGADRRAQRSDLLGEIGRTAEFVTPSDIGLRRELRTLPGRVVVLGEVGLFEEQDALRGDVVEGVPAVEPIEKVRAFGALLKEILASNAMSFGSLRPGFPARSERGFVASIVERSDSVGIICEKELMLRVNRLLDWPAIRLNQGFSW